MSSIVVKRHFVLETLISDRSLKKSRRIPGMALYNVV